MSRIMLKHLGLLMLLSNHVYALPSDRMKPLFLEADGVSYDNRRHQGVYQGHVKLTQGSSHLKAANAITYANNKNQLSKAVAHGTREHQAHFWTKTNKKKPVLHARANKITYFPLLHMVRLIGDAVIDQGKSHYRSAHILYDIDKSAIVSKQQNNSRTTIILTEQNHPS